MGRTRPDGPNVAPLGQLPTNAQRIYFVMSGVSHSAGSGLRGGDTEWLHDTDWVDVREYEPSFQGRDTVISANRLQCYPMLLPALVSLLDRYPVFVRKCFRDGGVGCWPLNLSGAHWCGLVVDGRRRRFEPQASAVGDTCQTIDGRRLRSGEHYMFVGYFDSMGGRCPPTLLSAVRRAIRRTRREQGDSACTWAWAADLGVMANMQALQNADTYQCGVWTLLFESFVLRFVSTKAPSSLRSWLRACAGIPLDAHARSVWIADQRTRLRHAVAQHTSFDGTVDNIVADVDDPELASVIQASIESLRQYWQQHGRTGSDALAV